MHGITNWMTDGEFPLFMPRPREQNTKVSLTPDQFDDLMATIRPELEFFGKTLN